MEGGARLPLTQCASAMPTRAQILSSALYTVIGTFEEWRLAAKNFEQRNSSTDLKQLTENGRAGRRVGPQRRNPGVHGGAKGVDREAHIVQTGHHQGDFRRTEPRRQRSYRAHFSCYCKHQRRPARQDYC